MKILLMGLPSNRFRDIANDSIGINGMLSIATYLRHNGLDVKIIDTSVEKITWQNIANLIKKEDPDIVGTNSYTSDIYERALLIRNIKKIKPSVITILGGIHVSLVPEETLRLVRDIDYAVLGEGEETFFELIKAIESGRQKNSMHFIKGIAYIHNDEYVKTESRDPIRNLDCLPIPDYSMISMNKYRVFLFPHSSRQSFSCCFSRGCSARCNFCIEGMVWHNFWRGRSAEKIAEELLILNKNYDKRYFAFTDADFFYDRKRNLDFIEEIRKNNLNIKFSALSRVDTLLRNKDLFGNLREAGLISLQIGIESFDQDTIDNMNKNYKIEQIREILSLIKKTKIHFPMLLFVIGNYGDDRAKLLNIINELKNSKLAAVIKISFLTPWPGTELFSSMLKKNIIKTLDYRLYNFTTPIADTKNISVNRLKALRFLMFYRWYFDVCVFFKNITNKYIKYYCFHSASLLFKQKIFSVLNSMAGFFGFSTRLRNKYLVDLIYKEHLLLIKNSKL